MSKSDNNIGLECLANRYEELASEINELSDKIRNTIYRLNPLMLLSGVRHYIQFRQMRDGTDLSIDNPYPQRSVEYIQSVLAAGHLCTGMEAPDINIIRELISDISELHSKTMTYFCSWTAKEKSEFDDLSDADVEYIVESQIYGNVRGKRYQFQQTTGILELLKPHEKMLQDRFGESPKTIIEGLGKLEYSLSSQRVDALTKLYEAYDRSYQENIERNDGKNFEKTLDDLVPIDEVDYLRSVCFGDGSINVKTITGWSDSLIESLSWKIGEYNGPFCTDDSYAWWPINGLPAQIRPFINISGISYCFDYYSLFDNVYRSIQDALCGGDESAKVVWAEQQKDASEKYVASLFRKIIPNADIHLGNYYPVKTSTKQMDENDIIITYGECIFVIEVKAGKFTRRPAILDYTSHKKSFSELIGRGNYQAERTINYIKGSEEAIFYDEKKNRQFSINHDDYKYYFPFVVTIDNMDVFECRIQQMPFLDVKVGTLTINIDDLELYSEYFNSPLVFIHYLLERIKASSIVELYSCDELDYLGMYINNNCYTKEVQEVIHDDISMVYIDGAREELDRYFNGLHESLLAVEKPKPNIPSLIYEILDVLLKSLPKGGVEFSNSILGWPYNVQEQVAENFIDLLKRQREKKYLIPALYSSDETMHLVFAECPGVKTLDDESKKYLALNNIRNSLYDECWTVDLECSYEGHVKGVKFNKYNRTDITDENIDIIKEYEKKIGNVRKIRMIKKRINGKKIYPNDPCYCGSGKKFKKCCGRVVCR